MERKQIENTIIIAEIKWSQFAKDEEGNAYLLVDEPIFRHKFGDNNDWRESPIREKLNDNLYWKIVQELGKDAIVPITVDLFSHDGLKDYGTCEDMVSILTYDLYRNNRENIKDCGQKFWTCTPDSTPSGYSSIYVRDVDLNGCVYFSNCGWDNGGVRPFFILKSSILI